MKNKEIYFKLLLNRPHKYLIKYLTINEKLDKQPSLSNFSNFKHFIEKYRQNKKKWLLILDRYNIIDYYINLLNRFNGPEMFNLLCEFCYTDKYKLFFINKLIDNSNIDISTYYLLLKNTISICPTTLLSKKNKRIKMKQINDLYVNQLQNSSFFIYPSFKQILIDDSLFLNYVNEKKKLFQEYSHTDAGILLFFKEIFLKKYTNYNMIKNYFLKVIPSHIPLNNIENQNSSLSFGMHFNQLTTFKEQINLILLYHHMSEYLIIKKEIMPQIFTSTDVCIQSLKYNISLKHNYNPPDFQIKIIYDSIILFLQGQHIQILGILPIIEHIYRKSYKYDNNQKISKIILQNNYLNKNNNIKQIFIKNSQLTENINGDKIISLNIKNNFFHGKLIDYEILECFSMYVFIFITNHYIWGNDEDF